MSTNASTRLRSRRRAAVERFDGPFPHVLAQTRRVARGDLASVAHGLEGGRVECLVRRGLHQRDSVGDRRLLDVALALEQRRAHQQRGEIPGIELQHLADREERAVDVLQLAADGGEVEPGGEIRRLERGERLEMRGGAGKIPGRECLLRGPAARAGVPVRLRSLHAPDLYSAAFPITGQSGLPAGRLRAPRRPTPRDEGTLA
jgi:hypothetical protein